MNKSVLTLLLKDVKDGKITIDKALQELKDLPYTDLGYARVDNHRQLRTGYPEIVYCSGKTLEQIKGIFSSMLDRGTNIIGTRATEEMYLAVKEISSEAVYFQTARIISIGKSDAICPESKIAVVTAGTSDIPVAEEAAVTAELLGNDVVRIYDVGVAGIHRLVDQLPRIRECSVVIVVAGMEGALASVVGGLIDKPLIAVPTSVGYGASFGGLSALLTMLTSCASGVTVVNIDNGFGAAYSASMINKLTVGESR